MRGASQFQHAPRHRFGCPPSPLRCNETGGDTGARIRAGARSLVARALHHARPICCAAIGGYYPKPLPWGGITRDISGLGASHVTAQDKS
jgi:hypothetical protein